MRLSRISMSVPDPTMRTPEPSFTPRSFRTSKPRKRMWLLHSIRTMSAPGTPVPSRIGVSPGNAWSVIGWPGAPLRGKTIFSNHGPGVSRTDTVSPGSAASSAACTVGKPSGTV